MVDYFKEALRGEGLVFVANSVMSPAMTKGDGHFLTPLIYSRDYIPFLLEQCKERQIGLLVSLFDIDLPVLAAEGFPALFEYFRVHIEPACRCLSA